VISVKIEVLPDIVGDRLEEAWQLYDVAFRDLNAMTMQRHLMYRSEFDDVMSDQRIEKWLVVTDDNVLVGLATYTNQLSAWPLISPEYFARRWPVHYAENRIWYCGFVAVPGHEKGVFVDLIEAMYRRAEEREGVISLDICRFNIEAFHLDRAIAMWLNRISGGQVRCEAADSQSFMIYETAPGGIAA
jgi:hypothetical protein